MGMEEGFSLLILGMGGVFVFLFILVILMSISAKFFTTYSHLFPEEVAAAPKPKSVTGSADEEIAVAIAAMKARTK